MRTSKLAFLLSATLSVIVVSAFGEAVLSPFECKCAFVSFPSAAGQANGSGEIDVTVKKNAAGDYEATGTVEVDVQCENDMDDDRGCRYCYHGVLYKYNPVILDYFIVDVEEQKVSALLTCGILNSRFITMTAVPVYPGNYMIKEFIQCYDNDSPENPCDGMSFVKEAYVTFDVP